MLFILFLFFKYLQPIFQEFDIVGDTFVKCIRRAERFAFGIQQNVKRLGVCTELTTLQVTPFVADCFQFANLAMLFDCNRLRQLRLIIDHQSDQDIIISNICFTFGSVQTDASILRQFTQPKPEKSIMTGLFTFLA